MLWPIILTLLPIVVIVYCMVRKQYAADTSGVIGWVLTLAITTLFFETAPEVGLRSSLSGIVASFPVSLMVVTSILQITFMEATGALSRITVFVKTFASANQAVQIMLINVGAGTLRNPPRRRRGDARLHPAPYPRGLGIFQLRGRCPAGHRL